MGSSLGIERKRGIVVATLNRPDRLNALNKDVFDELNRMIDVVESDKTARVIILTGGGEKAFCVGADLKERRGMNEKDTLARLQWVHETFARLENSHLPVIAAVNGMALGGGFELALVADIRIAADTATFGLPETSLAIIPGSGGTQRLGRVVGMGRVMELVLMGHRLNAHQALEFGVVNHMVPQRECLSAALEWAKKMMNHGPIALASAKRAIRGGAHLPMKEAIAFELENYKKCLYSKDRLEGLKAFEEKRTPEYRGE